MSNARNIARLLPNASGQLPAGNMQDASITAAKLASGAVGLTTSTKQVTTLWSVNNTSAYPNVSTASVTLSAAQAPIGSFVILEVRCSAGGHSGQMYLNVSQNGGPQLGVYTYGWFWDTQSVGVFPITSAADRTINIGHASITNTNDFRALYYLGYIMPTP